MKLWDGKSEQVRECNHVDFKTINDRISALKDAFKQVPPVGPFKFGAKRLFGEKEICFLEFCDSIILKDYDNISTQLKYRTIVNSLKMFIKEIYYLDVLTIENLRPYDFIYEYAKWLVKQNRQMVIRTPTLRKRKEHGSTTLLFLKPL